MVRRAVLEESNVALVDSSPQVLGRTMMTPEQHMRALIQDTVGVDMTESGMRRTPERFVRALREMTAGYRDDPARLLSVTFPCDSRDMVLLRGAEFRSLCEHHVMPFSGVVSIGYIPDGERVVGLSKLARLIDCFALRLQIQERLTRQIADALNEHTSQDVAVIVRARHHCMCYRGVRKDGEMVTSRMTGAFLKSTARAEFMSIA